MMPNFASFFGAGKFKGLAEASWANRQMKKPGMTFATDGQAALRHFFH